jgi:tRNA G18 (ribose-2'-O)-methylase SpoU
LAAELKTTNSDINNSQGSEYLIGLAAAREIWSLLFNLALTDPELSTGRYLHRGPTHRKKLRVWQALTVLCPAVPQSAVEETLALLLEALDVANAATVKQYQEIIALKMIQSQPDLLESMVLPLIADYSEQRNEAIPCLMSIAAVSAFFAAKKDENDTVLEETKKKELIKRAVSIMLPWTATFVHGSRTFAQLILWRMGQVYPWLQENDASYAAFFKFFHTNADLKRLRLAMGIDFGLDNFDFQRATSPKGILCEEMCLLGTSNTTAGPLEGVPEPLMDCLAAYLAQERFALRNEIDAKMADFALQDELRRNAVVQGEEGGKIRAAVVREATANGNGTASQDSAALSGEENKLAGDFYQRKITPSDKEAAVTDPWGAALGLAALSSNTTTQTANKGNAVVIDNFEADTLRRAVDEAVSTAQSQARQELIIVASLIDKLPNLAGLARTCEVFRASKLVLQDASITKDPTFTSISVSAEHWVPIEQVSPVVLAPWLRKKATEGYTLVGLEQTAESTRLQEFKFPKKTVLLLGAEKEGVPADLLALLDATVEIPQLGVVRSLNVHVSAAIGIYEFTRQSLAAA